MFLSVELIFEALSQCSSLHPDKDIANDDMDDAFISTGIDLLTSDDADDLALSDVGRPHSNFLNNNRYAPY
jgi:nucleotide-sensitive chloride channel 1A